jgi:hypothetical protein
MLFLLMYMLQAITAITPDTFIQPLLEPRHKRSDRESDGDAPADQEY